MEKYRAIISDIKEECEGIKTYMLKIPEGLVWEEGAHLHAAIKGFDAGETVNKDLVRHLSVCSLHEENTLAFTTRFTKNPSVFKKELLKLKAGDELILFKIGSRLKPLRNGKPLVFITQGIAFAAVRPVIHSVIKDTRGIPSVTSLNISRKGQFVFKEETDKLGNENINLLWVSDRNEFTDNVISLSENKDSLFYVIGSDDFIRDQYETLKNRNISEKNIKTDRSEEKLSLILARKEV